MDRMDFDKGLERHSLAVGTRFRQEVEVTVVVSPTAQGEPELVPPWPTSTSEPSLVPEIDWSVVTPARQPTSTAVPATATRPPVSAAPAQPLTILAPARGQWVEPGFALQLEGDPSGYTVLCMATGHIDLLTNGLVVNDEGDWVIVDLNGSAIWDFGVSRPKGGTAVPTRRPMKTPVLP